MGVENFSNCSNITLSRLEQLALVRGVCGVVCFVLCLLTLFAQLVLVCKVGLSKTNTLQRLFFYLTVSTVLYMGVLSLHIEHYYRGYKGQAKFCTILGFFDQYTGSVQLVFTFWIAVVLLFKIPKLQQCVGKAKSEEHRDRRKCGICFEAINVFVAFLIPLMFSWIPFKYGHYGETGPWCWIESLNQSCHNVQVGLWEQLGLWYIPYGFVAFCSLVFTLPLLGYFCWFHCTRRGLLQDKIKTQIGEISILCAFMCMFCVVFLVELIIDLVLDEPNVDVFTLWMVYAIVTPVGGVVIPIGFFVYLNFKWGKCRCRATGAHNHSDPAISEARRGIAPASTRISAASTTEAQPLAHSDVRSYSDLSIQPLLQISENHGPQTTYQAVET